MGKIIIPCASLEQILTCQKNKTQLHLFAFSDTSLCIYACVCGKACKRESCQGSASRSCEWMWRFKTYQKRKQNPLPAEVWVPKPKGGPRCRPSQEGPAAARAHDRAVTALAPSPRVPALPRACRLGGSPAATRPVFAGRRVVCL